MQKGNLEHYISQNREAFDTAIPDLKVWSAIDRQLHPTEVAKRRSILPRFLQLAAAAAILLLVGGFFFSNKAVTSTAAIALHDISTEHAEMENYYQRQINQKVSLLNSYSTTDQRIFQDLEQLDESLMELQEELQEVPAGSEEKIINAMIKNYQTKLMLLERVLQHLQSTNSKNTKKDETTNI